MGTAVQQYLRVLLCSGSRAASLAARRAWLPDVARAALSQGCCALCALRLAAISRPVLYQIPLSSLNAALLSVLDDVSPASADGVGGEGGLPRSTCVACLGLLQGEALFRLPPPGANELANLSAAQCVVRWGTMTPPAALVPPPKCPSRVPSWLDATTAAVAHSGFDLSGGIALSVSIDHIYGASDVAARTQLAEALGPERRLPEAFWFLRDVVRAVAGFALGRLRHAPCEGEVVSVFEYHRRCAAAAAAAAGAPAPSPDGPGAAEPLFIDLGNTAPLAGGDDVAGSSLYASWDREDAPEALLRELARELGGGPLAGTGVPDLDAPAADEAGRPAWQQWPRVAVRQDATLSVALSIEPPPSRASPVADTAASSGATAGKRRRPGDDAAPAAAPPPPPVGPEAAHLCVVGLSVTRGSVFLAGRYVKLARGLSQSSWFLQGKRIGLYPTSVEEEISIPLSQHMSDGAAVPVPPCFAPPLAGGGQGCAPPAPPPPAEEQEQQQALPGELGPLPCGFRFHAAGREDVDVRMLGEGRPFMVELMGAKSVVLPAPALGRLERLVNKTDGPAPGLSPEPLLDIRGVRPASKVDFDALQDGSQDKRKRYVAVCWTAVPQTPAQLRARLDLRGAAVELRQRTPMRVLHRRSLLTRRKMIYDMRTEWINPHFFTLYLTASAGAYIKEFVHGDLGRTTPSVAELLSMPTPVELAAAAADSDAQRLSLDSDVRLASGGGGDFQLLSAGRCRRGVTYPPSTKVTAFEADILQLDVVDVLMTLTPATAASASTARAHVPTKHGGTLGICESDDEEGGDDILPDSDDDASLFPKPAQQAAAPAAAAASGQGKNSRGGAHTQKSLSQKAVAAKMLTGGV